MEVKKTEKKKKSSGWQWIGMVLFGLIGFACGLVIMMYIDSGSEPAGSALFKELGELIVLFIVMYFMLMAQMVIHEAGHLVCGLASGYRFSSFRIMNLMWVKENEKIKFKRFSLVGTGGQCLMAPPDLINGKIPVVLYNLGGPLMNIITALIFLCIYFLAPDGSRLSVIMLISFIVSAGIGIINGVPMKMGVINNDGYNAYALTQNREALQAFWLQMKVNEQTTKGIRLKDMPTEWFFVPSDEKMRNSMIAVTGVLACNHFMDEQNFEEADKIMRHLLEIESGIVGIHRQLLICDRMYCELIAGRKEKAEEMLTKEQKSFMKSMKKYPSVLRTEYTYALLGENDISKAETIKTAFEKCAKTYPYPSEIDAERELL